ncbi:MAG: LexA family transcriptional regulator, partial [Oscillospiraceae bacterium]
REARHAANISVDELAERIGLNRSTLFRYESGDIVNIPAKQLAAIANVLGCEIDTLLYGGSDVSIPILGEVRAGIPVEAVEDILGEVEIPRKWARSGEFFALRVKGDSMAPRMHEGDVVIVRKCPCPQSGDVVVAMVGDGNATITKYMQHSGGISLEPYNRVSYEPMYFQNEEIVSLPVTILGIAEELRGRP